MAKKSHTSQGNSLPDHAAPDASDPNATELFFGNLPRSATVESLYTLCAHYAPVRSVVLKPPRGDDGASRGPIGFVSLRTHADALLVLQCLQDASMNVIVRHSVDCRAVGCIWAGARADIRPHCLWEL